MTGSPGWRLAVLGKPQLLPPDGLAVRCEGKTLALLAYLMLEGPTTRARLIGLLWPDTDETAARNNLVHLLRRMHKTYGVHLVQGQELLTLSPDVRSDVSTVLAAPQAAQGGSPPAGVLLGGVEYDDLPDLAYWLLSARERVDAARLQAYQREIGRLEDAGELPAAVALTERLLDLDPLSEDAWRHLMRLHYQAGDRPAALRAYRRCKDTLRRELGVEPSAPSARLAREIDLGTVEVRAAGTRIPLAVLRPPRLVGREQAWNRLEEAWEAGKQIFITGDPGSGKTRLAQDFLRSKGAWLYLPSRPGDQDIPFAAASRNARARIAAAPQVTLPGWVRRELSRLLPELRGDAEPPPLTAESDRHTFFLAHLEMARLTSPGFVATLNDDVQYYDAATADLGAFLFSHALSSGGQGNTPRFVAVYRRGELRPAQQARVDQVIAVGLAVRIDLTPLDRGEIESLLNDLPFPTRVMDRLPSAEELAWRLHRYTGGNLQFLLETVRHIIETGELGAVADGEGVARGFAALFEQRLARLSPGALHAARAAAVLRTDFTLEQIAEVLGVPLLEAAGAWEELDAAQIVTEESFSHDLVAEAVLAGTPEPVRRLLSRAAARTLGQHDAAPARVARQWLDGSDARQGALWLLRAAQAAEATSRHSEAAGFYVQAALAFEASGQVEQAEEARRAQERACAVEAPLP